MAQIWVNISKIYVYIFIYINGINDKGSVSILQYLKQYELQENHLNFKQTMFNKIIYPFSK